MPLEDAKHLGKQEKKKQKKTKKGERAPAFEVVLMGAGVVGSCLSCGF